MEAIEISTPAPEKIEEALIEGKNVVVTAGGISLETEARLKKLAMKLGLLFLGPECKSSIIGGMGFGIWNSVKAGNIGIVSTSTGALRELVSLVGESGISHALHVGGRDVSQAIGGAGSLAALNFLFADPETHAIIFAAPPPTMVVEKRLLKTLANAQKPCIICFLKEAGPSKNISFAATLEKAAMIALEKVEAGAVKTFSMEEIKKIAKAEREKFGYDQKEIRGIFLGRTLCFEAQTVLKKFTTTVFSNVPLTPRERLPDIFSSHGHACIDITARELSETDPSIDPSPITRRMISEAKDWETAVVAINICLGNGAHQNPAVEVAQAIRESEEIVERDGRHVCVLVRFIGTKDDPQNLALQEKISRKAGGIVCHSNAEMMRLAAAIVFGKVGS